MKKKIKKKVKSKKITKKIQKKVTKKKIIKSKKNTIKSFRNKTIKERIKDLFTPKLEQPKLDKFKEPVHKDLKIVGQVRIKEEPLNIQKFDTALHTIKKLMKAKKHEQAKKIYYNLVRYYNKNISTIPLEHQESIYKELVNTKQEINFATIREVL